MKTYFKMYNTNNSYSYTLYMCMYIIILSVNFLLEHRELHKKAKYIEHCWQCNLQYVRVCVCSMQRLGRR